MGKLIFGTALAGLLLGSVASASPVIDTTTQGNWIGTYGSQGYILPDYYGGGLGPTAGDDAVSLPSYLTYSYSTTATPYRWATNQSDVRAPQDPANPSGGRNAACAYNAVPFSVNLDLVQPETLQVGVYLLDWDSTGRDVTVSLAGQSLEVNNTGVNGTPMNAYNKGEWVLFDVSLPAGTTPLNVQFNSGANAVISGITFDSVPEPASAALLSLTSVAMFARRRRA